MLRCLSSRSPSYLSRLFSSPSSNHNTRSSSNSQLRLRSDRRPSVLLVPHCGGVYRKVCVQLRTCSLSPGYSVPQSLDYYFLLLFLDYYYITIITINYYYQSLLLLSLSSLLFYYLHGFCMDYAWIMHG